MSHTATPRPYEEWRSNSADRAEDAACTFGYYLMKHARAEAMKRVQRVVAPATRQEFQAQAAEAVDVALHNVMDLLEGFWRAEVGPNHTAEFALSVCVQDANQKMVERIDISPCLIDLPIGYWKWKDGGFR